MLPIAVDAMGGDNAPREIVEGAKLAGFEIVLERTIKTVNAGREKLRITPLPAAEDAPLAGAEDSGQHEAFFDQDEA